MERRWILHTQLAQIKLNYKLFVFVFALSMLENFRSAAAAAASCFFHVVRSLSLSFAPSVCGTVGGAAAAVAAVAFVVVVFLAPLFWTDSVRVYLRM